MTIYFDISDICTHALKHNTVTGIQRGAIRIIGALVDGGYDIAGIWKHPFSGEFFAVDLSFMTENYNFSTSDFLSRFPLPTGKRLWLASRLAKYRKRPAKMAFRYIYCHIRWIFSKKIRQKVGVFENKQYRTFYVHELSLTPKDCVVTLGAGWLGDYEGLHKLASEHGCRSATFVHDLIPLYDVWFNTKPYKENKFSNWLQYCASAGVLLLCNSHFTHFELIKQLKKWGIKANAIVTQYPHEFRPLQSPPPPTKATALPKGAVPKTYVLCVGTIIPRKNIDKLLCSWKKIEEVLADSAPVLVLAGANWMKLDIDSYDCERVWHIDSPMDAMLEELYRGCLFTVYPSVFEGWGLPIGESLWFGKPVLCGRASSMPEAGGRHADYFDIHETNSLYDALLHMIKHPRRLPASIREELRTWKDTAEAVLLALCLPNNQNATASGQSLGTKYAEQQRSSAVVGCPCPQ